MPDDVITAPAPPSSPHSVSASAALVGLPLLLSGEELQRVWLLRRMMSVLAGSGGGATEPTERLLDRLAKTKSNTEFLENLTAAEA